MEVVLMEPRVFVGDSLGRLTLSRQRLFLSSMESKIFAPVRECEFVEPLAFDTGKPAMVAHVTPAIIGQDFGFGEDIDNVILTARHAENPVDDIQAFPCFVFITIPSGEMRRLSTPIRSDDLRIIAWGELYRSADDARNHRFG
jgi:hypothetical protein